MARCDPTVLSLFTGAGGLDIGLEAAGYRTAVSVEMAPACVATLKANRSWPIVARDIHNAPTEEILAAGGLESGEVDLLAAGPPCQPFSKAGYWATGEAGRLDDLRASTLNATLRVIREARPRAILIENVDAIGYSGKSEGLRRIIGGIERINEEIGPRYSPVHAVLDSAWYGAPQRRRRLIVVASRDGRRISLPRPTHGPKADLEGLEPYRTAWDALGDLGEPEDEGLETTGRWADLLPSVPEGRNYLWHTDRGGGIPLFGWRAAPSTCSWTASCRSGSARASGGSSSSTRA